MASVASVNPFAFLNDDDEGNVVGQTPVAAAAKDKKQPKDKKKAAAAASSAASATTEKAKPAAAARTGAPANRSTAEGRDFEAESRGARPRRGGPRPVGRGGRGGRGGGRSRDFDRHSATGKVDTEKKVNQSWGHAGAEYEDGAKPVAKVEETIGEVSEEDQEPAVKTLDEYLSERAEKLKLAGVESPEVRKANTSDDRWKNTRVFSKNSDEENFFVGKSQNAGQKQKQKQKRGKVVVPIEQRFEEASARSQSSRGGFRGGRGAAPGASHGRRTTGGAVPVDDQSAFPALG